MAISSPYAAFAARDFYGPRAWSRLGVFARIFAALAAKGGAPRRLMIDATHLKAHRTAASLLQKGGHDTSAAPKVA